MIGTSGCSFSVLRAPTVPARHRLSIPDTAYQADQVIDTEAKLSFASIASKRIFKFSNTVKSCQKVYFDSFYSKTKTNKI